jgi:hypothetical protein
MSADHVYVCAENTTERCNALGVFRFINPIACPEKFAYSTVFRKEWGWDMPSFEKGYYAYEIHDIRIFPRGPISVHYGCGPQFAGHITVQAIANALRK